MVGQAQETEKLAWKYGKTRRDKVERLGPIHIINEYFMKGQYRKLIEEENLNRGHRTSKKKKYPRGKYSVERNKNLGAE